MIFSAYLLVSLHAEHFKHHQQRHPTESAESTASPRVFHQHPHWEAGTTWKSALNNLRLLLQPYWCWAWVEAWLQVFSIPGLKRALHQLMDNMDRFRIVSIPQRIVA